MQPTNSRSLYQLGNAQLRYYDNEPDNKDALVDAEVSYRSSIELEGKPSGGKIVPDSIRQQKWFKEKEEKLAAQKKVKEATMSPQKTVSGSVKAGTSPVKGVARGGATVKGGASVRGRGAASTATGNIACY